MSNLSYDTLWTRLSNNVAAGTTNVNTSILDMAGYDGVIFMASISTVVNNANIVMLVQQNSVNSNTGMVTAVDGRTGNSVSTGTITSDGVTVNAANTDILIDFYRPTQEFVQISFQPSAQNVTLNGIWAIQYKARKKPTIQGSKILSSLFFTGTG